MHTITLCESPPISTVHIIVHSLNHDTIPLKIPSNIITLSSSTSPATSPTTTSIPQAIYLLLSSFGGLLSLLELFS